MSNAAQLRSALLDASTSSIELRAPVILDPGTFVPVSLDRAVSISAATPAAFLDFGGAQEPLISITAGGNLTLQGLRLAGIHPAAGLPLPLTQATSMMPVSAIKLSRSSAHLVLNQAVLLVDGQLSNLTDSLPFWAARQQQAANEQHPQPDSLDSSPEDSSALAGAAAAAQPQPTQQQQQPDTPDSSPFVSVIPMYITTSFGGSSTVRITDTALVVDSAGCIALGRRQLLAWDSLSLLKALQVATSNSNANTNSSSNSFVPEVVLLSNISLRASHWPPPARPASSGFGSARISTCSSSTLSPTILDFNHMPQAIVLQPGATLQFDGSMLVLLNAAHISQLYPGGEQRLSWPFSNRSSSAQTLLLLGSVDVSQGAQLQLLNVSVGVADVAAAQDAMQQVKGAGGSTPELSQQAATADGGRKFVVSAWNTTLAGWSLGGFSTKVPAANGEERVLVSGTVPWHLGFRIYSVLAEGMLAAAARPVYPRGLWGLD